MREALKCFGLSFILNGLLAVGLTVVLAVLRSDNEPAAGLIGLYGIAYAAVAIGAVIVKCVDAWPHSS